MKFGARLIRSLLSNLELTHIYSEHRHDSKIRNAASLLTVRSSGGRGPSTWSRRCGPPRRIPPGAVAPGAVPFGAGGHSARQGLAPGATALKRTDGGTARATRTGGRRHRPRYPD